MDEQFIRNLFNWNVTRRGALKAGLFGLAAPTVLSIDSLFHSAEGKEKAEQIIKVTDTYVEFPAVWSSNGIVANQYVTLPIHGGQSMPGYRDALKRISIVRGEKTPKMIKASAYGPVVFSDQLRWDPADTKTKGKSIIVPLDAKNINYVLAGKDKMIISLEGYTPEQVQKIKDAYDGKSITSAMLDEFAAKYHGVRIQKQVEAIKKLSFAPDADGDKRVQRYLQMAKDHPAEFVNRMVTAKLEESMYEGLAKQGVVFAAPSEFTGKVGPAIGTYNHKDDLGKPIIYVGAGFARPSEEAEAFRKYIMEHKRSDLLPHADIGNIGITPCEDIFRDYDAILVGNFEIIKGKIGESKTAELMGEVLNERKRVYSDGEKYFTVVAHTKDKTPFKGKQVELADAILGETDLIDADGVRGCAYNTNFTKIGNFREEFTKQIGSKAILYLLALQYVAPRQQR